MVQVEDRQCMHLANLGVLGRDLYSTRTAPKIMSGSRADAPVAGVKREPQSVVEDDEQHEIDDPEEDKQTA